MAERKLIDWIKSQEAKGISDSKLKITLRNKGWPVKDVDKAIHLAHKKRVNWLPLLTTFFISLVLFAIFWFSYSGELRFSDLIGLIVFILPLFFLGFSFLSIPFYIKSGKREPFLEVFILLFTAGMSALVATTLLFNFLVLLIYLIKIPVTIPLIIAIASCCIILFFYVLFFTISRLSTHFMGYFDHESFFVYKHWPFKIFNVNWKKKWTLLKYPVFVIIVGLVIFGFTFNHFINEINRSVDDKIISTQYMIKSDNENLCWYKYLVHKNISIIEQKSYGILQRKGQISAPPDAFGDVDLIYTNCDFHELTCEEKPFYQDKKLEEQIFLEESTYEIKKIYTKNATIILLPQDKPYDYFSTCSNLFSDERMKLKAIQEVENDRKDLNSDAVKHHFSQATWSDFSTPLKETIIFWVEYGLNLGFLRSNLVAIEYEWNLTNNEQVDLIQRTEELKKNIEILYPMFLDSEYKSEGVGDLYLFVSSSKYSAKDVLSFEDSLSYLLSNLLKQEELSQNLKDLRENHHREKTEDFYQSRNIEESRESKIIRLKIIETLLAQEIIRTDPEKKEEIITLTQSRELFE